MSESLLGLSEVLIFGREIEDLLIPDRKFDEEAEVATTEELDAFAGLGPIDDIPVEVGDTVLVHLQKKAADNGLYTVQFDVGDATVLWDKQAALAKGAIVYVKPGGEEYGDTFWEQKLPPASGKQKFKNISRRVGKGLGRNRQLDDQLGGDARFARIYGFSYEGTYFELPNPTLFLVHGTGKRATSTDANLNNLNQPPDHASRAPFNPSLSGVGAADFQIADDIRVWAYDKADYTIRMDVETGMFEQVLLEIFFGGGDAMISGAKVSGAKVSGAKVSGAKVSGAKVSGAKVSGAKARGPGD